MFPKRPNNEEDEDDLLSQQKAFLNKNGKVGAATKIKVESPVIEAAENFVIRDNHDILRTQSPKIIERDIVIDRSQLERKTSDFSEAGFPIATQLLPLTTQPTLNKKKSLYAQKNLKQLNNSESDIDKDEETETPSLVSGIGLGKPDWKEIIGNIKQSNEQYLSSMSQKDVEQLRKDVMEKLSSKTVSFLKSKRFPVRSQVNRQQNSNKPTTTDKARDKENDRTKIPIPLEEIQANNYINMDVVEHEKLKWIEDAGETNAKEANKNEGLTARFNFEGDLVVDDGTPIDTHYGLHHHGEEPDRAGYNITELFLYLQSSFAAQKQLALGILKRIINKAYLGSYDSMLNQDIEEYLLKDTLLVLIVRTCLDDTNPNIWKQALSTLKAILCNTLYDEVHLDRGFILFEILFQSSLGEKIHLIPPIDPQVGFNETMTDEQWASHDIVDCLVQRTSILSRLYYLVKTFNNDSSILEDTVDILIRIARHSPDQCFRLFTSTSIVQHLSSLLFGDNNINPKDYTIVHVKLLKLIRVCLSRLSEKDKLMAIRRVENNISLVNTFKRCLVLDLANFEANEKKVIISQLIIESQRLWLCLLHSVPERMEFAEKLRSTFSEMSATIFKQLQYCLVIGLNANTFDYQYASYLVVLIYKNIKMFPDVGHNFPELFFDGLYNVTSRWTKQLNDNNEAPNFDLSLCIFVNVELLFRFNKEKKELVGLAQKLFSEKAELLQRLIQLCLGNSNFNPLRPIDEAESSNLPSFGSLDQFRRFNTVPVFSPSSPVLFLFAVLRIMNSSADSQLSIPDAVTEELISYIDQYTDFLGNPCNSFCIFDVIEMNLINDICTLLTSHIAHTQECNPTMQLIATNLFTNALIGVHRVEPCDLKVLMIENVLFAKPIYQHFIADIDENKIDRFRKLYAEHCSFDTIFWLFDPILQQKQTESTTKIDLKHVLITLEFIVIVVTHFKKALDKARVDNSAIFACLCSIFLIDEDMFFDKTVAAYLEILLYKLPAIKCSKSMVVPYSDGIISL